MTNAPLEYVPFAGSQFGSKTVGVFTGFVHVGKRLAVKYLIVAGPQGFWFRAAAADLYARIAIEIGLYLFYNIVTAHDGQALDLVRGLANMYPAYIPVIAPQFKAFGVQISLLA